jgi:RNA polymerase sigma-70 factor (ECF subfamily)
VLRVLGFLGVPGQDREDVAQEVFLRVFRHFRSYRRGREFGAWIYRVTVNAAHDYRGRTSRRARDEAPWSEGFEREDTRPGPAEAAMRSEAWHSLEAALDALSERERTIFVLRELEGLESREISRALGITSITVRRHLSRARRRLRAALEGPEEEQTPVVGVERIAPRGSSHG